MKNLSTELLAGWLTDDLDSREWAKISLALSETLKIRWKGHSQADCEALAEERESYVAEQLRNNAANAKSRGEVYPIEIDSSDPYVRSIVDSVSPELNLLRKIDPILFEHHCREILEKLGGKAHVTPKTNDGGIDFYATDIKLVPEHVPFPLHATITVVGQAKRYDESGIIRLNEVRQFVGSTVRFVADLRSRRLIPDAGPVLLAFWTTSSFHSGAMEYAKNIGVWTVDGRAMVNLTKHCELPFEVKTDTSK